MNKLSVFILSAIVFLASGVLMAKLIQRNGDRYSEDWIGRPAPELSAGDWLNSKPLKLSDLNGKVVLLEFWTFGCRNCLNTIPILKQWYEKYGGARFTAVGVHTPEFDREKNLPSLRERIAKLGIAYPVVTDNDYRTWDSYGQHYWPTIYLIDKKGIIRYVHIGEGNYEQTERMIKSLIEEKM